MADLSPKLVPKIYRVSELNRNVGTLLEAEFGSVWVEGEVSNFRAHPNGHYYFTLKDQDAQLPAVMFRGHNRQNKFQIEDGITLIVHGRLTVYGVQGKYQIVVDTAEPAGIGALQLAFEQLKKKLTAEGLFDAARKKPLPFFPERIGIVTSESGAAIHDLLNVLYRRLPSINVTFYPVRVQGAGAKEEIAAAIEFLGKQKNIDVLIVGRGGGSLEDLWAFNEEVVARAIYHCPVPVISAVGHETDFTIADFVADVRAPTPSAAAELAVPSRVELQQKLDAILKRLPTPARLWDQFRLKLIDLEEKLLSHFKNRFIDFSHRYHNAVTKLKLLSPQNILERGYTMALGKNDQVITRAQNLKKGEEFVLNFFDGKLSVVVKDILNN